MGLTETSGQGRRGHGRWVQGRSISFAISLIGLMQLAVMSAVSAAARPVRYTLPTFLDTPIDITGVMGSDVILPCSVQNLGTKSVIWKKVDQVSPISVGDYVFDPYGSYEIIRGDNRQQHPHRHGHNLEDPRWDLLIRNVVKEHQGTYECNISVKQDVGRNITLKVIEDRSRSRYVPKHNQTGIHLDGTMFVEKGQTITLNCTATSINYRPKGVDWFKDGSKIKSSSRVVFTNEELPGENVLHSWLQIKHSVMADAGTYICRFSVNHVASIKVMVLNTDSSNKRRGTDRDGLDAHSASASSDEDRGGNSGATSRGNGGQLMLIFVVLVITSLLNS